MVALLSVSACTCAKKPDATDAGAVTPQAKAQAPVVVQPPGGPECARGLRDALKSIEAVPPEARVAPALKALGDSCAQALGGLAKAGLDASAAAFPQRAELLANAAKPLMPPTCVAAAPAGPALELSYACPPPSSFELAEPLLRDLDAGTYVYALAVRERLGRVKALDDKSDRVLMNLVLGGALEGERRRKK